MTEFTHSAAESEEYAEDYEAALAKCLALSEHNTLHPRWKAGHTCCSSDYS